MTHSTEVIYLSLEEITTRCHVEIGFVRALIHQGVVELAETEPPRLRAEDVLRIAKAARLSQDLGVNPEGIAVILDLLDRIDALESELRARGLR